MFDALDIEPAGEAAPQTRPASRLRVESVPGESEVAMLVVAGWIGKKRFCEARVLERGDEGMAVLAAAPLERGEQVWLGESDLSGGLFVRDVAQEGEGFRLDLHQDKRRSPRWRVDEPGELEWRDGDRLGRANVVVVDVSAGGLRVRSSEPIPEEGDVRVKFAGMVRDGEIRYRLPMGGASVAGIELV